MTLQLLAGPIIRAGESLSEPLDCTAGQPVRVTMPGDWTGDALLTFQISTDGVYYNPLYHSNGEEVSIKVVPGAAVVVPSDIGRLIQFIKFCSGKKGCLGPQPVDREFSIAIETTPERPSTIITSKKQENDGSKT
jgi:hypothetical protein